MPDALSMRKVPLRWTIATLVVVLLVLTVFGSVAIALLLRRQTLRKTAQLLQQEISERVVEKIGDRFAPLLGVLRECAAAADRGVFDIDDEETVARWLAERVRYDDRFEMLAFLRPDGSGAGALRDANRDVRVLMAGHTPEGAPDVRAEIRRQDGSSETASTEGMDLTGLEATPMYALGAASEEPAWTAPYIRRVDGTPGRAGVYGYRRDGDLKGVFAVGVGLAFLEAFARSLDLAETGRVFFLDPESGAIRVAPTPEDRTALEGVVHAALAELEGGPPSLGIGRTRSVRVSHAGGPYVVGLARSQPPGLPVVMHALVVPERELVGHLGRQVAVGLLGVLALLAFAIVLAGLLSRRVATPLRAIARDLERVGTFDLAAPAPAPSRIQEVNVLGEATRRMKASLRSFGRYVPQDVVRSLVAGGGEARLGGTVRPLSLFFSDVQGFTSASEGVEPRVLVEALGEYLDVVTSAIQASRGTVDKFIGDGVLAFFNAPLDDADHAVHASRAALEVQRRLADRMPKWEAAGRPSFKTRIGLHVDDVLVGNIGTPDRFGYTVIGDGVNFAARLESLNKAYGTWILASEAMRRAAGDTFVWRAVDLTAVAGRREGGRVYELLGETGAVAEALLEARHGHEEALEAYLARDFRRAAAGFAAAARLRPEDKAAPLLAARAAAYAEAPPPEDWSGVHVQTQK